MVINLVAPRIDIKYQFNPRIEFIVVDVPEYEDSWEYNVLFAASSKQLGFDVIEGTDTSHVA